MDKPAKVSSSSPIDVEDDPRNTPSPAPETDRVSAPVEGPEEEVEVEVPSKRSPSPSASSSPTTTTNRAGLPPPPPPAKPAASLKSPPPTSNQPVPATPASNSAAFHIGTNYGRPKGSSTRPSPRASPTPLITPGMTPTSKTSRGLRHFSVQVCKFVEAKKKTTYNEVADNLVHQVILQRRQEDPNCKCDEKNIRRRVYDALNVLMAMDIIYKDKKDIIWRGLPSGPDGSSPPAPVFEEEPPADYHTPEYDALLHERDYHRAEVSRKHEALREILVQQICFRNLVMHNQRREHPRGGPHNPPPEDEKIPLPFIISNTKPSAVVQCDMNPDKTDVMFEFDSPFEINDDNTILKRMDMDKIAPSILRGMLPEDMMNYCEYMGLLDDMLLPEKEQGRAASSAPYAAYDRSQRYIL